MVTKQSLAVSGRKQKASDPEHFYFLPQSTWELAAHSSPNYLASYPTAVQGTLPESLQVKADSI